MAIPVYNERSGVELVATFRDEAGTPQLPTTVSVRVLCETTGQTVSDWASATTETTSVSGVPVSVTATVEIPGASTAIIDQRNAREIKLVQIVADKDTAREYSETFKLQVKRMRRQ